MSASRISCLTIAFAATLAAQPCAEWGEAEVIGQLDPSALFEASGLAISSQSPGRIYHLNDGSNPRIFVTDYEGETTHVQPIENARSWDLEALSLGPCPDEGSCLYLADSGDNHRFRGNVRIHVVREHEPWPSPTVPIASLTVKYPDGIHDAEGFAVHPDGDLYILTKEADWGIFKAFPAKLYRLRDADWESSEATFEAMGEIDLPELATPESDFPGKIVTGMDISADGKTVLVLTYQDAYELDLDLSSIDRLPSSEALSARLTPIRLEHQVQQEAIAYLPDLDGFLYTSERAKSRQAPMLRVSCKARRAD